ncbi:GGDEF domain-containing protein [Magnetovibrio sp. PR-2]|uniref:GGDEF domain-containing protein n=1 Tax=Magnetovibrio sp. PR-2 TaxID=3120356 RepID=UPI002FCE112D
MYHQMMVLRNALFILMFPLAILAGGLALSVSAPTVPFSLSAAVAYLPYALCFIAAIVGGWFKRPRVVLMAGLVALAHGVVQGFVADTNIYDREPGLTVVYAALAVLFPINAVLIALKPDRGLLSVGVLNRVLFASVQIAILIVIWDAGAGAHALADEILHLRAFDKVWDQWTLLPQPALILFVSASLGLLARALWNGGALDGGLFGAVAVSALGLHAAGDGALSAIMFSLAGVVLLAAVAQESYRLAFIDELTDLPGRRALMHDLLALSGDYTVAMLDVDHFKKFNDTYGHDVGDQVLKMVAARMMAVTGGGRAFRYGGEEFTVLFPRKDTDHAVKHLDSLRQAIEASSFMLRAEDRPDHRPEGVKAKQAAKSKKQPSNMVSVTISIGAAGREEGQTPEDTLKAADEALYRAKDGGRNRVSI